MKTIITIFLIALTVECSAQVAQEWTRVYDGPGNRHDEVRSMVVDDAGNVYVTGYSFSDETHHDYATIKYNSAGVRQWVSRYDFNHSWDQAESIAIDDAGNVYVTGQSHNYGLSDDYATIKYNSSGVQQWIRRYNGPSSNTDCAFSVAVDEAGNVYVTGYSWSDVGGADYLTLKYTSNGSLAWIKRYNGTGSSDEFAHSIAVDGDGNVYVSGYRVKSETDYDYLTVKYNSSGTEMWVKTYGGSGNGIDKVNSLVLDEDANVYITGYSKGVGTGNDCTTIKYTSYGNAVWIKRYNGPVDSSDYGNSLAVDDAGNVYVTGGSRGSGTFSDYLTIKYNSNGTQQWVQRFDGGYYDSDGATDIALDGSGNVYVTGITRKSGTDYDFGTIKYNSSGEQKWVKRYNGAGDEGSMGISIGVDGSNNVYVAGYSDEETTSELTSDKADYRTIKYTQNVIPYPFRSEIPAEFSLSQNYPNPFNPVTNIRFDIPNASNVKLTIFDITGREIEQLVNNQLEAGTYNIDFDASHLATGTYFYKINAGDFTEVKKMILIK
jgi:uncharacterized delta-60 repeat protein